MGLARRAGALLVGAVAAACAGRPAVPNPQVMPEAWPASPVPTPGAAPGYPTTPRQTFEAPPPPGSPPVLPPARPSLTPWGNSFQNPLQPPNTFLASRTSCVDRELASRGLNAYGDPAGTTYPPGQMPPARARGWSAIVARHPDIGAVCFYPPPPTN
jgi:hypothetical protein